MEQTLVEQEVIQEEESYNAIPICGGNYITPVTDQTHYLEEVHYSIGGRTYIENAD